MPKIAKIRPVLLSAPYADARVNAEVMLHLPSGMRTTGMVEITLDNGVVGLGEGYLAVFAPAVFKSIVELVAPVLVGRDPFDLDRLIRDMVTTTGYWSLQGAAQHVVSAFEIALQDCRAQTLGIPVSRLLGGEANRSLKLYASGGDSVDPQAMAQELNAIKLLGIDLFKIRARNHQAAKAAWCQREGKPRGIEIAVDMTQNLAVPSQSVGDILGFLQQLRERQGSMPYFLEEVLGPQEIANLATLRTKIPGSRIAGGEIVTTASELCHRIERGCYDIAQPDATVIGGITPTVEVFSTARRHGVDVYVHCWGGPVGMMANYHAAIAGGGRVAEWPLPRYVLRDALAIAPWEIEKGMLTLPDTPGLGLRLTPEIEQEYPFRPEAVYRCLVDPTKLPAAVWE